MKIRHLPLFTLRIAHEYYGDIPCMDFDFIIAEHSRRVMAGAGLLSSTRGGRLYVSFEADEAGLPVQDIAQVELLIGLRLRNPHFEYFTAALPEPRPLYTNGASWNALSDSPQVCDLATGSYAPEAATDARPLTLAIFRQKHKQAICRYEVGVGEEMPVIDIRTWPTGCYTVTRQADGKEDERVLVIAPDLALTGIWGMIRIVVTPDFWLPVKQPQPPDFHVDFDAVKESLDYYIVAPQSWTHAFDSLSIGDMAPHNKLSFQKHPQTAASKDGIPPSLLGVPGQSRALLFRSAHAVARKAAPEHQLQLNRGGETLINNLPLPGAGTPVARFIVHISKPS